jgi:hypothetical protein
VGQLVLTVTRACNLRCSYCPTAKAGWPALDVDQALAALRLFVAGWGGGDVKLFGGEPLLEPAVVRAVMDAAAEEPAIRRVYLSTNGLGLDTGWLAYLRAHPKAVLTISLDGRPDDHRRHRRALPQVADAYDHVMALVPELLRTPRVVVTQTIAPSVADHAHQNFAHLLGLGFWRFNLLPGYYLPWSSAQLAALRAGFDAIAHEATRRWQGGARLYLRNLFTWAPTPFFNGGLVVDADGSIHPTNLGLSGALEELLDETRAGTLDDPPSREALEQKAEAVTELLARALPPRIWQSTLAVDAELSRFCRRLYPAYLAERQRRRGRGAA